VQAWVTATAYTATTVRRVGSDVYYCLASHTSGVFADDLEDGLWAESPLIAATLPVLRINGLPVGASGFGWDVGMVEITGMSPRTRTMEVTLEAFGYEYDPPRPLYYSAPGRIDPGPVVVTLEETEVLSGNPVTEIEMEVLPGGSTETFASSLTNVFTELRPIAVRRKR
jgi:hypothetical protein